MANVAPLLLRNIRLPDGRQSDLLAVDGRIERIAPDIEKPDGCIGVDGAGALALPGMVDGHLHVDKTLFGDPWTPHPAEPDRESRIRVERELRHRYTRSVEERALGLVRHAAALGTCAMRTHVDIDTEIGLANLHAVLGVRERTRHLVEMQIVAFPQSGVVRSPGLAELLDAAIGDGADLIGGIDPIGFDGDLAGQFDILFGIAKRRGVGLDVHLHDSGPTGLRELGALANRTKAAGMQGRVTASHAFCLGACRAVALQRMGDLLAEAGVSVVTHGGGASPVPPVKALRALGVMIFAGNDNIRDAWSPYGDGDMLERAMLTAWRSGFRTDDDLAVAFDLVSGAGAAALSLSDHGIVEGGRADFFTVPAETVAQAVVDRPIRSLVVKAGRVVARDGAPVVG
ncbi:MAG: amidohydrolase family protein [Alphaproteobacteria bacterium]|nr:amidohydrolase family protein [Alphaproteobacteria bacterium]